MLDDKFKPYRESPPKRTANHCYDWASRIQFVRGLNKPGVWYVLQEYPKNGARGARHRLQKLYPDFQFRSYVDKTTKGSKLYGRLRETTE